MASPVKTLNVQHDPVCVFQKGVCLGKIQDAVAVDQIGKAHGLGFGEQLRHKTSIEGALPARAGDPPDKGAVLLDAQEDLLHRHLLHLGGTEVGAGPQAAVTPHTEGFLPMDFSLPQGERPRRAGGDAGPAVGAQGHGLRVVAVLAAEGAPLEEDGSPVAWPVHYAVVDDFVYRGDHRLRTFRSRIWPLCLAPMPKKTVSLTTCWFCSSFSISDFFTRYPVMRMTSLSEE